MYKKFLNARSPLRLLEQGLHGGLGPGNLGVVLAGHGVGKTPFLVGVALDELLHGRPVLHVSLEHAVAHVREYYDTVFDELAASTHLEHAAQVRADLERKRHIRVYGHDAFTVAKLREAVKLAEETNARPAMVLLDEFDLERTTRDEVVELKALAGEIGAEVWMAVASAGERVDGLPASLQGVADQVSVILALDPDEGAVRLRAMKDHDNPDVSALHVALDPRTLLLVRS